MGTLTIIEASTSGHTTFVLDEIVKILTKELPDLHMKRYRAETVTVEDVQESNALLFGSGTWNTGGIEGQLNPYMHELLFERLKNVRLEKPMAFVSLGDDRYYFTTRCTEHFLKFQKLTGGESLAMPLIIVNEPYDQTVRIQTWAKKLANILREKEGTYS